MIYCLCFLLLNTRDIWANVENQSLTLQLKEASLKELFQLMEKQSQSLKEVLIVKEMLKSLKRIL